MLECESKPNRLDVEEKKRKTTVHGLSSVMIVILNLRCDCRALRRLSTYEIHAIVAMYIIKYHGHDLPML